MTPIAKSAMSGSTGSLMCRSLSAAAGLQERLLQRAVVAKGGTVAERLVEQGTQAAAQRVSTGCRPWPSEISLLVGCY